MNSQPRFPTRLLAAVVALLTGFTSGGHSASAAEVMTTNAVVIELRDGSRLVGRLASDTLEFESEVLGLLRLPLARLDEMRREGDPPRLVMLTRSGDRSTGELVAKELRLTTSFGEISLPRAELLTLRPHRAVDSTGLRHHWPGERDAQDSVGRANGETSPAVRFAAGRKGRAFTFNGQGEGVRFGEDAARFGGENFTLAFWFRAPKPQLIQYVMTKRAACQPVPMWEVRCEPGGQVSFVIAGMHPDFKMLHLPSRGIAADDTWHHVVITRSGRKVPSIWTASPTWKTTPRWFTTRTTTRRFAWEPASARGRPDQRTSPASSTNCASSTARSRPMKLKRCFARTTASERHHRAFVKAKRPEA